MKSLKELTETAGDINYEVSNLLREIKERDIEIDDLNNIIARVGVDNVNESNALEDKIQLLEAKIKKLESESEGIYIYIDDIKSDRDSLIFANTELKNKIKELVRGLLNE